MPSDLEVALAKALRVAIDPTSVDVFGKLGYVPTPKQREFHEATEYDVCFGGARGGGKSTASLMEGIKRCVHHRGLRAGIIRNSLPEIKKTLIPELAKYGFARALGASWNGSDFELRFPNRSVLWFGYCESLADTSRYQGQSNQLLDYDDRTLLLPEAVDIINETLRSGDQGKSVIGVRSTCNPGGPGHGAIKTKYIDATEKGRKVVYDDQGRSIRYIPARVQDNPHVGEDYVRTLMAIPDPARRKAMLEGDWDAFGGQFFGEWSHLRHIVPAPSTPLPASWVRWAGIDYGSAAPYACLWVAFDNDGRAWVYRERYKTGLHPKEQAEAILQAEEATGEEVTHVIDPSTDNEVHAGALSIRAMYAVAGLPTLLANNDRIAGWQTVHGYLAEGPLCPYHLVLHEQGNWAPVAGDVATCPLLHVLDGAAPNLVRTLPSLPRDPNKVEDVNTKAEDHAADALRYLLHMRGGAPKFIFSDED